MNNISEVTRSYLLDIIKNGFNVPNMVPYQSADYGWIEYQDGEKTIYMKYNGRISEVDFLKRLYRLDEMPSHDKRFSNALDDIIQHRVTFHDGDDFWFFDDDRFKLKEGSDDIPILRFICLMFHPIVRDESKPWKDYLNRFNELLQPDGYELYPSYIISNREVYEYREYIPVSDELEKHLFTHRYKGLVTTDQDNKVDLACGHITDNEKNRLIFVLEEFSQPQLMKPDRYDNLKVTTDALYIAMSRLNEAHEQSIIILDDNGYLGRNYSNQLKSIFTPFLFDLIELQYNELSDNERKQFRIRINTILQNYNLSLTLSDRGLIEFIYKHEVINNAITQDICVIQENGLRNYLEQAIAYHMRQDVDSHKIAMEKMWDAFERLKTYYGQDKNKSVTNLVDDISRGNENFKKLFEEEFKQIKDIGNKFGIRHSEIDQIEISDPRHYDYFFNRCLSLIALAIQYLK